MFKSLVNYEENKYFLLRCHAVDGLSYVVTQYPDTRKITIIACTNCTIKDRMSAVTDDKNN